MRNIVTIIFLLISFHSWAQNDEIIAYQKDRFELAISFFEKSEFETAADLFSYVHKLNPNNELGQFALKKVDSLKPVIRKNFIESITGKWKLSKIDSNWLLNDIDKNDVDKFILIDNNQILFYEQNKNSKEMKLIKTENIKFIDQLGMNRSFTEFADSKKQIWSYTLDESSDILRVINNGEETKEGRTESVCGNIKYYYERIK
jgi:hypothetical protein